MKSSFKLGEKLIKKILMQTLVTITLAFKQERERGRERERERGRERKIGAQNTKWKTVLIRIFLPDS